MYHTQLCDFVLKEGKNFVHFAVVETLPWHFLTGVRQALQAFCTIDQAFDTKQYI